MNDDQSNACDERWMSESVMLEMRSKAWRLLCDEQKCFRFRWGRGKMVCDRVKTWWEVKRIIIYYLKLSFHVKGEKVIIIYHYYSWWNGSTKQPFECFKLPFWVFSPSPSPCKISALNNILLFSLLFITLLLYHKPLLLITKYFFSSPHETKTLSRFTSHHE